MATDYISREAAIKEAYYLYPSIDHYCTSVKAVEVRDLNAIPAADVAPVIHAHWIRMHVSVTEDVFTCSLCKRLTTFPKNAPLEIVLEECPYCHCGAKMDEEVEFIEDV